MMRSVRAAMAFLAAAAWAGAAAAADLRLISIEAAPWAWTDAATGTPMGVFPEVVREIERRTGHRVAMSLQALARIERSLEVGEQDCAVFLWNPRREAIARLGETVYTMPFGVIPRRGLTINRYDDMLPLAITVIRNLRFLPAFDDDARLRKDFDTDYLTGLQKMVREHADAIAGAIPTIRYIARQAGLHEHLGAPLVLAGIPIALQCARNSPQLDVQLELDAAIAAMRADGTLAAVLAANGYD